MDGDRIPIEISRWELCRILESWAHFLAQTGTDIGRNQWDNELRADAAKMAKRVAELVVIVQDWEAQVEKRKSTLKATPETEPERD